MTYSNSLNLDSTLENNSDIIVVDSRMDNYQSLISGIDHAEIILLDSSRNGIEQITEALTNFSEVDSIQIISHGQVGSLQLGSANLNADNLDSYSEDLAAWSESLTVNGDILLFGCNVGTGSIGLDFISDLSQLTNADIAASNDLTGSSQLGGDWDLEVTTGDIEADLAIELDIRNLYDSVLEAFIDFDDFSDTSQLTLNGNATQVGNVLRLTSAEKIQRGSSFFNQPLAVDSNTSFETQFQFQLSGGTGGADGFTFMLQNDSQGVNALGGRGGGLGYRSITQSLAIDFDTYQNDGDLDNNHISILRDGDVNNALAAIAAPFDLNSGSVLNAWIDYDGVSDLLEVFLADTAVKPETVSLSLNIDLASVVGSQAFLGFSSATGGLVNNHDILNWEFATVPPNPGVIGLETSNYNVNEQDGTVDVTILRTQGSDGVVSIDYDTIDDSAEGDDYTAVSGTVTFADGETSKTVTIPILDDDLVEGNENFSFTIDNLVGDATLFAPQTALINIIDDDETASEAFIDFDDFSDTSQLTLNGHATQIGNVLRLTSAEKTQKGSSFFNQPLAVDSNTSFETQFQFQLSGGTGGADGFTFMLQNNTEGVNSLGITGGGLGYRSITQSLAIDFDTYQNDGDLDNNHISILRDGDVNNALAAITAPFDLNSGSALNAWIDYDGVSDLLEVFLADTTVKPEAAALSLNIDLASVVGSQAFLGFSAATGGLVNNHDLLNWEFATVPYNPGVIGLETSIYNVNEQDGTVDVTILRTDGSDGVVSINYDTFDASATAGDDYTDVSGTVTFADGETSKTVTIPITDDDSVEGNEDFSFTIDNLVGDATLFAPRTAIITIFDDETGVEPIIDFDDFTDISELTFNGDAIQAGNVLRLTPSQTSQNGTTFFNRPLAVDTNTFFETQFQFQISGGTSGSDGFTFMLQNNTEGANNGINTLNNRTAGGGGLGYRDIPQSLAIEFDTFQNPNSGDINHNHLSILRDGDVSNPLATIAAPFDLNSGSSLNAWIDYDGVSDLLEVFLADTTVKPETASLSLNIDLASVVGSQAFLGFSAATGGSFNNHDILNWEFTTNSSLLGGILPNVDRETVISGLNQPTAIEWTPNGDRFFIAEKSGVIKIFQNDQLLATPFIDISAQVNDPGDRGLLDIAVHPDFFDGSPYVYALYAYDPPEVFQNTGLAGPDGKGNRAGRLTRITADASTGYTTAVPGSEVVILGTNSTWANFNAFVNSTVDFDEPPAGILADGTNLEDFLAADSQTHTIGSVEFGLDGALYVSNGDGTAYNQVDPRTVRVQDIDNLSGKILRIDPITGDGLPDNPFYNGDPNANRSKVYQYGLRNPFRMTVHPETGQVYVGDVGWTRWEEINAAGPGANFGWPYYEGGSGISLQTRDYEDLPEAQAFYASGESVIPSIFAANHITDGINAIILGDFYTGNTFPEEYQGDLFFNDLGKGVVRNLNFDESGNVTSVETFATGANIVVQIMEGPDGNLYYVDLDDGTVGRWFFSETS